MPSSRRPIMKNETLVERLRKRAEIRQKITCRGPEDRLSKDLIEAANKIEELEAEIRTLDHDLEEARDHF